MAGLPPWIGTSPKRLQIETITPTEEERRNGWTEESLSQYVAERRAAQAMLLDPHARPKPRPTRANGYRWNFPVRGRKFGPWASRKR
jgi:hypothetical protein